MLSLLLQAQTQNIISDSLRQAIKLHKEIYLQSDNDIGQLESQNIGLKLLLKRDFSHLQMIAK